MIKNGENSESYEIEPCQVVIPGVPLIANSEEFSNSEQIQIAGVRTLETSAKRALRLADDMLKPVRADWRNGRFKELLKLLETRPEFSAHPWIREEILKWIKTGRSFTKRGRRIGTFEIHPLIVAAAVDEIISRRTAAGREQAFAWLANNGWREYETAKKQYYKAIRNDRFRAVLIQNSIWSTPIPKIKARRLIHHADRLYKGKSINRTLCDSPMGAVTVTLTAI